MTAGPGVVMVAMIAIAAMYRLDDAEHGRIVAELQDR